MQIPEFLNSLAIAPHIEVIVARVPKVAGTLRRQFIGDDLLQHLDYYCQAAPFWFAHQQMNMFRHYHVSDHQKAVPAAHSFEGVFKSIARFRSSQQRRSPIATEGDEVQITGLLKSHKPMRHARECTAVGWD